MTQVHELENAVQSLMRENDDLRAERDEGNELIDDLNRRLAHSEESRNVMARELSEADREIAKFTERLETR